MTRAKSLLKSSGLVLLGVAGGLALAVATGAEWYGLGSEAHIPLSMRLDDSALRAALEEIDHAAEVTGRAGRVAASGALSQAILFSRARALAAPTYPIPEDIKRQLAPYFPKDTLDKTRWTTARGRLDLGGALAGWYYKEGAVTLKDIVVFSHVSTAQSVQLWAHELTHVRQYEELGVNDFARLYAADWTVLEDQAWSNSRLMMADMRRQAAKAKAEAEAQRGAERAGSQASNPALSMTRKGLPAPSR